MAPCCTNYPKCTCSKALDPYRYGRWGGKAAQQGPLPRYMARLDAAEAVCAYIDKMASLRPREGGLWRLLEAWRKAKEASER